MNFKEIMTLANRVIALLGILPSFVCLIFAAAAILSGCSTVFTGVAQRSGATCDTIEIQRQEGQRHRCGIHIVEFDGIPASEVCIEGSGWSSCTPPRSGADLVVVVPESWPAGSGTLSVEQSISGTGCALLGALGSRSYEFPFTVTEQRQPPLISRFGADETVIEAGESTTLRWAVTGTTTAVRLDAAAVAATGLRTVSPTSSQTYRLTAENVCLSSSDTVTVCVNTPQTTPTLTSVDSARPGSAFRANGRSLSHISCAGTARSALVFSQSGTTFPAVVDATPAASHLDITLPIELAPGEATVFARVGTLDSAPFTFTVEGRQNGEFQQVTLRQGGTFTCGTAGRTLTVAAGSGTRRTAIFRQGGTVLRSVNFNTGPDRSGAALSPGCDYGVVVGKNTFRTYNTYTLNAIDLGSPGLPQIGATDLGRGVQVLFSPDDSVVLYKAQDNFRGDGFASISLHDLRRRRAIHRSPGNSCSLCDSISATMADFNEVTIIFDSRLLLGSPHPVE